MLSSELAEMYFKDLSGYYNESLLFDILSEISNLSEEIATNKVISWYRRFIINKLIFTYRLDINIEDLIKAIWIPSINLGAYKKVESHTELIKFIKSSNIINELDSSLRLIGNSNLDLLFGYVVSGINNVLFIPDSKLFELNKFKINLLDLDNPNWKSLYNSIDKHGHSIY